MGVVALYLFAALIATSLLRRHIGQRTWRAIHWASYAMWPLAVAHGITAGSDATSLWMLAIDALCVTAVLAAVAWRVMAGSPNRDRMAEVVATSSFANASRGELR
jgi:methionine sulfoxide reductase heme-binding subunit